MGDQDAHRITAPERPRSKERRPLPLTIPKAEGSHRPRSSQKRHKATPTGRCPQKHRQVQTLTVSLPRSWQSLPEGFGTHHVPPRAQTQTCCHRLCVGFTPVQTWVRRPDVPSGRLRGTSSPGRRNSLLSQYRSRNRRVRPPTPRAAARSQTVWTKSASRPTQYPGRGIYFLQKRFTK